MELYVQIEFENLSVFLIAKALHLYTHVLTYFSPMSHFYSPWKRQKTMVSWRFHGV